MLYNSKLLVHFVRKYFLMTVERMNDTNGPTKEEAMNHWNLSQCNTVAVEIRNVIK
jgi:hypothetical protein